LKRGYQATYRDELTLLDAAGPRGNAVFQRQSGVPLEQGITRLLTYEGYHDFFSSQVDELAVLASSEIWVLDSGAEELSAADIQQLQEQLRERYFADYIETWDQLIADIRIIPFQSVPEAKE